MALPSGIAYLQYDIHLDPLSAYFNVALGIVAVCTSIYSLGYLKPYESRSTLGLLGSFYNLLLLSLTFVFSASNVFFS
jgi:hydrogenase-4 component B